MKKQMTPQAKPEVNAQPREVYTSAGEFLVDGGSLSTLDVELTPPRPLKSHLNPNPVTALRNIQIHVLNKRLLTT